MKSTVSILALALLLGACANSSEPIVVQAVGPDDALVAGADLDTPTTFVTAPGSKVWFVIEEMFRGSPKTVVGVNTKVAAEVIADVDDPSTVVMGPVVVKAAYFDTEPGEEPNPLGDEIGWRDTAINRFILDSSKYPTITFTPAELIDLRDVAEGSEKSIVGDLTVRGITQSVTFTATFDVVSPEQVRVTGWAEVRRRDFDLTIPKVAHVAGVADDLRLEFDLIFEPSDG